LPAERKETKAQKAERIKAERNPWVMLPEILEKARQGFEAIPDDDLRSRLRWWGLYTQGDGGGVYGGEAPYFMARVRLPSGILFSHQLREVAALADRMAKGMGDVTVRQNIQLHWIRAEDLPELFAGLGRVNLTTLAACGDDTRNVTGCPLAGLDADEHFDASPVALGINRMLAGNDEFYNLPRKWKICATGCRAWCSFPEINDVAFTGARRQVGGREELGFSLRVGGGLSTEPFHAVKLDCFVSLHQAFSVARAATELFRDSECLRQYRNKARMKYLFLEYGYTPDSFLAELQDRLGFRLDSGVEDEVPKDAYRDHVGIHPQKQEGLFYAGINVLRGRLTSDQMRLVADLSERYGDGQIRTTGMQNLVVPNVRKMNLKDLEREALAGALRLEGSPFARGTIACTGTEFCKLALTETKSYAEWLVGELDRRMPDFDRNLRINVNGCPNACGQHWIADVGLQGRTVKREGKAVPAYDFFLGGGLGEGATFGRRIGYQAPVEEVPEALERVLGVYANQRLDGETFREFCSRHDDQDLKGFLSGEARDG
jgi:sulfite reductase (ferredoxin)